MTLRIIELLCLGGVGIAGASWWNTDKVMNPAIEEVVISTGRITSLVFTPSQEVSERDYAVRLYFKNIQQSIQNCEDVKILGVQWAIVPNETVKSWNVLSKTNYSCESQDNVTTVSFSAPSFRPHIKYYFHLLKTNEINSQTNIKVIAAIQHVDGIGTHYLFMDKALAELLGIGLLSIGLICFGLDLLKFLLCKIMRSNVDPQKIERLMKALGREARGSGCIYFTGGASALLIGWRSSTVDIDLRLDPEPPGIFQAIAKLKQELDINIELASPQDFLPQLPGWRDRSIFIGRQGEISFYHYDFTAQALAKLSRGYNRDIDDVRAMYQQKLFSLEKLHDCFNEIEPELIRFPALDPDLLRNRIERFIEWCERKSEREQ
jgi:hypothetical protein